MINLQQIRWKRILNPMEWLTETISWFYGRWFVGHSWFGFLIIAIPIAIVFNILLWLIWIRGVDRYHEKHPRTFQTGTLTPPEKSNSIEVYELFRAVHATHAEQLRKPLATGQRLKRGELYQAAHQHAIVIWLRSKMRLYRLETNTDKWDWKPEPDWEMDMRWVRDSDLRRRFKPPVELGPPYAGVAARWAAKPGDWKWIGWRKWHCYFFEDSEHLPAYQGFERGIVIAGLRAALIESSEPQMFILLNDGRWSSVGMTGVKAPSLRFLILTLQVESSLTITPNPLPSSGFSAISCPLWRLKFTS